MQLKASGADSYLRRGRQGVQYLVECGNDRRPAHPRDRPAIGISLHGCTPEEDAFLVKPRNRREELLRATHFPGGLVRAYRCNTP